MRNTRKLAIIEACGKHACQPCKTRIYVSTESRFRVVLYSSIEFRAKCFFSRCLLLLVQRILEIANEWRTDTISNQTKNNFKLRLKY